MKACDGSWNSYCYMKKYMEKFNNFDMCLFVNVIQFKKGKLITFNLTKMWKIIWGNYSI